MYSALIWWEQNFYSVLQLYNVLTSGLWGEP